MILKLKSLRLCYAVQVAGEIPVRHHLICRLLPAHQSLLNLECCEMYESEASVFSYHKLNFPPVRLVPLRVRSVRKVNLCVVVFDGGFRVGWTEVSCDVDGKWSRSRCIGCVYYSGSYNRWS